MAEEILYRDSKGGELYLPDGVGEKQGFERIDVQTPPELLPPATGKKAGKSEVATPEKPSLKAAIGTIQEFIETATDEEATEERLNLLTDLTGALMNYDKLGFSIDVEQTGEGTGSVMEATDGELAGEEGTDDESDTTNPQEGDQPGKARRGGKKVTANKPE